MTTRVVYLMRGLPSCGKSTTARKLTGGGGIVLETDEFFYAHVGDDPTHYDYREALLPAAQQWNFDRFRAAVERGDSPIVVDRGNGRNAETNRYARHAVERGYKVELTEPESDWWQEIRNLLARRPASLPELYAWADRLASMSRATHRVPSATIRRWMEHWQCNLTVEDVIRFEKQPTC